MDSAAADAKTNDGATMEFDDKADQPPQQLEGLKKGDKGRTVEEDKRL